MGTISTLDQEEIDDFKQELNNIPVILPVVLTLFYFLYICNHINQIA
jgi:hypothetical protein